MPDLLVQSFSNPAVWHTVSITDVTFAGEDNAVITSCTCTEFVENKSKCKHMFLGSRFSSFPINMSACFELYSSPSHPTLSAALQTDDLDRVLSSKSAITAQILEQVEQTSAFCRKLNSNVSRDDLLQIEGLATRLQREVSELAQGRTLYSTQT